MNIRPSAVIQRDYNRRKKIRKLHKKLSAVEKDRLAGHMGCTLNELNAYLDRIIAKG